MGKIRRGNFIFVTYKGDHSPKHVHVFKDEKEIAKWDLENNRVMNGKLSSQAKKIIEQLVKEGLL